MIESMDIHISESGTMFTVKTINQGSADAYYNRAGDMVYGIGSRLAIELLPRKLNIYIPKEWKKHD